MLTYKPDTKEVRPFNKRVKNWLYFYLLISASIIVSFSIQSHWIFGIIVGLFSFIVWFIPIIQKQRFYITKILTENNCLTIFYKRVYPS